MKIYGKLPKPYCAVCGKKVDYFEISERPCDRAIVGIAECHGAREEAAIPVDLLNDSSGVLTLGLAFAQQQIGPWADADPEAL